MAKIDRDPVARIMAVGAVVIGMGAVGGIVAERNAIQALENERKTNYIGDCINENILRSVLGARMQNYEECMDERQEWRQKFDEAPLAPTEEPKPSNEITG